MVWIDIKLSTPYARDIAKSIIPLLGEIESYPIIFCQISRRISIRKVCPHEFKYQWCDIQCRKHIHRVMFPCGKDERHDGYLKKCHYQLEPFEVKVPKDDTYEWHCVYGMTWEHEITASIGGIDAENDIVKLCWWCPAAVSCIKLWEVCKIWCKRMARDKITHTHNTWYLLTLDYPHPALDQTTSHH